MYKRKRLSMLALILLVVYIMYYFYLNIFVPEVYVQFAGKNKKNKYRVSNGDVVSLTYNHSSYKVDQTEVFVVHAELGKNQLYLQTMIFGDANAFYYYNIAAGNYYTKDDKIYLNIENEQYRKIPMRMSYSKTHIVRINSKKYGDRKIVLSEEFQSGEYVEISISRAIF